MVTACQAAFWVLMKAVTAFLLGDSCRHICKTMCMLMGMMQGQILKKLLGHLKKVEILFPFTSRNYVLNITCMCLSTVGAKKLPQDSSLWLNFGENDLRMCYTKNTKQLFRITAELFFMKASI